MRADKVQHTDTEKVDICSWTPHELKSLSQAFAPGAKSTSRELEQDRAEESHHFLETLEVIRASTVSRVSPADPSQ